MKQWKKNAFRIETIAKTFAEAFGMVHRLSYRGIHAQFRILWNYLKESSYNSWHKATSRCDTFSHYDRVYNPEDAFPSPTLAKTAFIYWSLSGQWKVWKCQQNHFLFVVFIQNTVLVWIFGCCTLNYPQIIIHLVWMNYQ